MKILYKDGPVDTFQEAVAGALVTKADHLVELTTAGKIQLANAGLAIGTVLPVMHSQETNIGVALLNKAGTARAIQAAAIVPGKQIIVDTSNPGQVIQLPASAGTYRTIGIKKGSANGAADDVIEFIPLVENVTVT